MRDTCLACTLLRGSGAMLPWKCEIRKPTGHVFLQPMQKVSTFTSEKSFDFHVTFEWRECKHQFEPMHVRLPPPPLPVLFVKLDKTFYSIWNTLWGFVYMAVCCSICPRMSANLPLKKKKKKKPCITTPLLDIWSDTKHTSLSLGIITKQVEWGVSQSVGHIVSITLVHLVSNSPSHISVLGCWRWLDKQWM